MSVAVLTRPRGDTVFSMRRAFVSSCLTLAALATAAAVHATPAVEGEAVVAEPPSSVRLEWVGIELSPISLNSGHPPSGQDPTRFQPGPGGTLRVLRHRWTQAYWTPLQAGLFVGEGGSGTIFTHLDTEGGGIFPLGEGTALELGMAAGIGILAIRYASGCDGSCNVGGAGVMLSPVVRYLFQDGPVWTMGATARAVIPLQVPSGDWFGYYAGRAVLYLVGFELAVGSP
jgi:hypothetical protein